MGIEIKKQRIQANGTYEFEFTDIITQYFVGISGFRCSYPDGDHHVKICSITLDADIKNKNTIPVKANMILEDASGHRIDSKSWTDVSVIAWTSSDNVAIPMSTGLSNDMAIPCENTPDFSRTSLSGFSLAYSDNDHHVRGISASTRSTWATGTKTLIMHCSAGMNDDSGNNAVANPVHGSVIAYCGLSKLLKVLDFTDRTQGDTVVEFDVPPDEYAVFISSFSYRYGSDDHHLKEIKAQITPKSNGKSITLSLDTCFADDSGDTAGGNKKITGFVLGLFNGSE